MTERRKSDVDRAAIVSALEQLSQTMDVMQQIIRRLQRSVDQATMNQSLEQRRRNIGKTTQTGDDENSSKEKSSKSSETPVLH